MRKIIKEYFYTGLNIICWIGFTIDFFKPNGNAIFWTFLIISISVLDLSMIIRKTNKKIDSLGSNVFFSDTIDFSDNESYEFLGFCQTSQKNQFVSCKADLTQIKEFNRKQYIGFYKKIKQI